MGILDSIIRGTEAVVNAGARSEMGMDTRDYERRVQGKKTGFAGKVTAMKNNRDLEKWGRERNSQEQTSNNNASNNKKNTANLDEAIKSLQFKDPLDAQDMDDEEATKVFQALYENDMLPEGFNYEASSSGKKNAIMAYLMLQNKK